METSNTIEKMLKTHEPPEEIQRYAPNEDFANSTLNARVVLEDRARNGLKIFFRGLVQQLQCCN